MECELYYTIHSNYNKLEMNVHIYYTTKCYYVFIVYIYTNKTIYICIYIIYIHYITFTIYNTTIISFPSITTNN